MNISREQYHRFLQNQCSEEESNQIISYLEQHPEVLEQWLHAQHWEQFEEEAHLHPAYTERMRKAFGQYLEQRQEARKASYRWLVAAAIIAIVATPVLWMTMRPQSATVAQAQPTPLTTPQWETIENSTDTARQLVLQDQSIVKLEKYSTLRYKKKMDSDRRDIYLEGTACFTVAKDKHRPFTVYAGGVATTAVGTIFSVTTAAGRQKVKVVLYEGKVKVRPADSTTKADPVYLTPGQELAMSPTGRYDLQHLANNHTVPPAIKKNKPAVSDALTFANVPLVQVLEQLQQKYSADIRYNKTTIASIYVTASFTDKDTLSGILSILCTLNDLQLENTGNVYSISR